MGLHKHYDNNNFGYSDVDQPEDQETVSYKRLIRKKIEDKLESKRLRQACKDDWDEFDDEFDWEHIDK